MDDLKRIQWMRRQVVAKETWGCMLWAVPLFGSAFFAAYSAQHWEICTKLFIFWLTWSFGGTMLASFIRNPRANEVSMLIILWVSACNYLVLSVWGFYVWASQFAETPTQSPILLAIAVLWIGRLLFLIRSRFRWIYGLTEIVAGFLFGGFALYQQGLGTFVSLAQVLHSKQGLPLVTATASAIYVVVRGFDNYDQGKKTFWRDLDHLMSLPSRWRKALRPKGPSK